MPTGHPTSLLLDIGNTSIHCGIAGHRLEHTFRTTEDTLDTIQQEWEVQHPQRPPDHILLASVNPEVEQTMSAFLHSTWDQPVYRLGSEVPVPIDVNIAAAHEVGDDRLLNATAVWRRYDSAAIAVDCGTAVTFDVITADGAFDGGVIAPGISISAQSLHDHTAMLPDVEPEPTGETYGQDTETAIRTGIYHGFTGMVRHILKQIKREIDDDPLVIGLGGDIHLFDRPEQLFDEIDPELTLKGLLDAWSYSRDQDE